MELIKEKKDTDWTDVFREVFKIINSRLGYTARISDIWSMLKIVVELEEDYSGPSTDNSEIAIFESYLMDCQFSWQHGDPINFTEMYERLKRVGEFSSRDKRLMDSCNMDERLWAIMVGVCSPELKI